MNTLVTICIPDYNGQKYLEECITSAIYQTYKHLEILVIDDCSNDNSIQIVDEYKKIDNRIKHKTIV